MRQKLIDLVRAELGVNRQPGIDALLARRQELVARLSDGMTKIEAARSERRSPTTIERAHNRWLGLLATYQIVEDALIERLGWERYVELAEGRGKCFTQPTKRKETPRCRVQQEG